MTDDDVVAAARAIRAELFGDPAKAAALDAILVRADAGERVAGELVVALAADADTRAELRRRLPLEDDTERLAAPPYAMLVGFGDPAAEQAYACTVCDYAYPVFEAGEPVPDCPRGHGPLAPKR